MVIAEATYFIGSRMGPAAEAAVLRGVTELEIESPTAGDWQRMATLDRRHFSVVRSLHADSSELLPA